MRGGRGGRGDTFRKIRCYRTAASGIWYYRIVIKQIQIFSKPGNSQSQQILPTDSWAKFVSIDLFVVKFKSGNSQSQQILPTDSWARFAAIDLIVVICKSGNSQSQQILATDFWWVGRRVVQGCHAFPGLGLPPLASSAPFASLHGLPGLGGLLPFTSSLPFAGFSALRVLPALRAPLLRGLSRHELPVLRCPSCP